MRTDTGSVARLTEAMARAQRHWRTRGREAPPAETFPPKPSGFTIALTREAGALGTTVAHALGQRLGWPVYDHELVERIAQEMGLRVELLESVDERRRNWLEEAVEQFAMVPSVSESMYLRHVIQIVLSLGAHGECVIVGRGAAHILPFETMLRVRMVGALNDRIANLSRRLNLSWDKAARKVEELDRERRAYIREHFQKDAADPREYDLVLNCSRWSVEECVDLIVEALERLRAHALREAR